MVAQKTVILIGGDQINSRSNAWIFISFGATTQKKTERTMWKKLKQHAQNWCQDYGGNILSKLNWHMESSDLPIVRLALFYLSQNNDTALEGVFSQGAEKKSCILIHSILDF